MCVCVRACVCDCALDALRVMTSQFYRTGSCDLHTKRRFTFLTRWRCFLPVRCVTNVTALCFLCKGVLCDPTALFFSGVRELRAAGVLRRHVPVPDRCHRVPRQHQGATRANLTYFLKIYPCCVVVAFRACSTSKQTPLKTRFLFKVPADEGVLQSQD